MSEGKERPKFTVIQGGKKDEASQPRFMHADNDQFDFSNLHALQERPIEEMNEAELENSLVRMYQHLQQYAPANFRSSIKPMLVTEHAQPVKAWSVKNLHEHLTTTNVWKKPSLTEAIFQEIEARMQAGNLKPRA